MRTSFWQSWRIPCALLVALLAGAVPAAAKSYVAERFDAVVRVLPGGTLDVTETVTFRFEEGTFREVFREIPLRRTDGVDVLQAEMQGQRLPFGTETGTAEVRRRSNRIRVVWRFNPIEGMRRTFVLNYRVHGAIREGTNADVLAWRALPDSHQYRIESTAIRFELPVPPAAQPEVRTGKAAAPQVALSGNVVQIEGTAISQNGWIEAAISLPRGSVIAAPPAWQQHAAAVEARSSIWMIAGGVILAAGLLLLFAWRQSYDSPPEQETSPMDSLHPAAPDSLPPAVSGAVAANGRAAIEHAMAALFTVADRGELDIREKSRGVFGQRDFQLTRRGSNPPTADYEQAALDIIFKERPRDGSTVTLSQARNRLMWRSRTFARAMDRALAARGLLDPSRKALRNRYNQAALWLFGVAGLAVGPAALVAPDYGAWPMLVPAVLAALAVVALIFAATITPLSNDGVRRARRWRQYKKQLEAIARSKYPAAPTATHAALPFAIALGLAGAWSKFLKNHGQGTPAWFHGLPSDDGAFAAFVAMGGAGASSGGGAPGTGAAGGGASGAR